MADASASFHEPYEVLEPETLDRHRGVVSLMEELEAIDWYQQRIDGTDDAELQAILAHNRDEEKEHAMMTLEWLRRHDAALDEQMRTYLFTGGDILAAADAQTGGDDANAGAEAPAAGSLGIGSLREAR